MGRKKDSTSPEPKGAKCRWCGGELEDDGFCRKANGFPYGTTCPFSCPTCGGRLKWNGACQTTACMWRDGRPYFPGDSYCLDGMHQILHETGPSVGLTREEVVKARAVINLVLGGEMKVERALQAMDSILKGEPVEFKRFAAGERAEA